MQRLVLVMLSVGLMLLASSAGADAKIRVVTTIPDLADMARNIGGDLLDIKSLATGVENLHASEPCRCCAADGARGGACLPASTA